MIHPPAMPPPSAHPSADLPGAAATGGGARAGNDAVLPAAVVPSATWRRELLSPWAWTPPVVALLLLAALGAGGANRALFLWLNGAGRWLGATAWMQLTLLGDGAVALALVLPCIRRAPRRFWAALAAALIAAAWVQGIKHLVDVPRPLAVFAPDAFAHAGPAYRAGSFPSGHAAAAFALAGVWVITLRGTLVRLGLLALASLVALSRVMVGVHWPSDLLGGMLGGWCGAWAGLAVAGRRGRLARGWGTIVAAAVLLAVSAGLLVSGHVGAACVLPLQRLIGGLCLVAGSCEAGALLAALLAARMAAKAERTERRPDG